ncbi:MAG: hypothetical protein IIX27_01915 [Ruminococcus sp.]|nr:hypothetical protein [Ruminococcus sp.]
MRNAKVMKSLLCVLTALVIIFSLSLTCFAHDEIFHDEEVVATEEMTQEEPSSEVLTEAPTEPPTEAPTQEQTQEQTEKEEEETEKPTEADKHTDELPEVESQDIIVPTIAQLPEVEVSDTSLLGGVIMWLCVALGVAVIAGVLVSQRARQGSSSRPYDSRRK